MPVDFFKKEVEKYQERFNQTYGVMVICNIRIREAAIMSIANLGLLCRKITAAKRKHEVKDDIRSFMRIGKILNNHFDQLMERRHYEPITCCQGQSGHEADHGRRDGYHLQELRKHLPKHLAESG